MTRGIPMLVLAAAFATPALAESATDTSTKAAESAMLAQASGEREARQHLARQGYVNISPLEKDSIGRWSGTAQKDGKTVIVAIDLRGAHGETAKN